MVFSPFRKNLFILLRMILPLVAINLSHSLVIFVDRFFIAQHAHHVLNAITFAGATASIFHYAFVSLVSTIEVIVAEYNGAKKFSMASNATWQMLCFSLALYPVYILLGIFGTDYLIPTEYQEEGRQYFSWMMFAGPLYPIMGALIGFFVGINHIKPVVIILALSTLLNISLDFLLIPLYESAGAAVAGISSQFFIVFGLSTIFLSSKVNSKYSTRTFHISLREILACLKIGLPTSIFYMFDLVAWTWILWVVSKLGENYISLYSVGESLLFMVACFWDSLSKSLMASCSDLIGRRKYKSLIPIFYAALGIHLLICGIFFLSLWLSADYIVLHFWKHDEMTFLQNKGIFFDILFYVCVYSFADGLGWIFNAFLTSMHKSVIAIVINTSCMTITAILPLMFIFYFQFTTHETTIWRIMCFYAFCNSTFLAISFVMILKKILGKNSPEPSSLLLS